MPTRSSSLDSIGIQRRRLPQHALASRRSPELRQEGAKLTCRWEPMLQLLHDVVGARRGREEARATLSHQRQQHQRQCLQQQQKQHQQQQPQHFIYIYIYIYIYMWWGQIDGIGAKLPGDREATSLEALCVIY
jgi:hypothetical protein